MCAWLAKWLQKTRFGTDSSKKKKQREKHGLNGSSRRKNNESRLTAREKENERDTRRNICIEDAETQVRE